MDNQFFSINYAHLPIDETLGVDLYVNASAKSSKDKFVRIFPANEELTKDFFAHLKKRYQSIYVHENQRNEFLKLVTRNSDLGIIHKAEFIKDSAINYLKNIFESNGDEKVILENIEQTAEAVTSMVEVIKDKNIDEIKGLIAELSFYDFYTFDHSVNVSMYCINILKGIKKDVTEQELTDIGVGALLHDIGKLKVPTSVINKPSSLSDEEFEKIKRHPIDGYKIISAKVENLPSNVNWDTVLKMIHEHHEHYDGSGYPLGKKDKEIHHYAKICMIADIFDALTTQRSYNNVMPKQKAIEIMTNMVGVKINPELFKQFLVLMDSKLQKKTGSKLEDKFDPSVPFKELEVEDDGKVKDLDGPEDFGKIITKAS